jgi:hypothetical protein
MVMFYSKNLFKLKNKDLYIFGAGRIGRNVTLSEIVESTKYPKYKKAI